MLNKNDNINKQQIILTTGMIVSLNKRNRPFGTHLTTGQVLDKVGHKQRESTDH